LSDEIESVLLTLKYREREVLKLRFGLGDCPAYAYKEIGKMFKVTGERIRQIEEKALRRLRSPTRARRLEGFLG